MKSIFTFLKNKGLLVCFTALILLSGCNNANLTTPKRVIKGDFDIYKFSGTWYEIASMNDVNLTNSTINFSVYNNEIKVIKSSTTKDNKVVKDEYKARFGLDDNKSMIEISKFGLVYEPLYIVKIDAYKYALIYGKDHKKLHILSRTKQIPALIEAIYLENAKKDGYNVEDIKWINQK
ncbi:lipocalin family protein [Campylobacter ureolyticus]|uniref:lipocalin family protein n=1 Tax=Campylobacter ureolyticus TaxID=827 RepID=UPI001FC84BB2|nr:lipocalin family protein [Campylobacter ureolyticus]MCZ6132490.1 lipocalin family protein [Campylobacter ureolyticus]MCZ6186402.1 lipocalin family protein [Campylobacter ureolyticus]